MTVLTIDRSKWRRGGQSYSNTSGYGGTWLLNSEGFMCCLGFDALACGFTEEQIRSCSSPESLVNNVLAEEDHEKFKDYIETRLEPRDEYGNPLFIDNHLVSEAIDANDASMDDSDREAEVRQHLMRLGWNDVQFVGEYPAFEKIEDE